MPAVHSASGPQPDVFYSSPTAEAPPPLACTIVVPFFNEASGAPRFVKELAEALGKLSVRPEVLLIDDGSTDATAQVLEQQVLARPSWRLVRQPRNMGQAAALLRGMRLAASPMIVTLDGDGQNDPADIQAMLARLGEADRPDMVAGVRAQRKDSWLRRRMSRIANAVRQRILRDGVRDTGCGLKAFRREVVEAFLPIRTLYSFMPALAVAAGFRVVEQPVSHRPRLADESKYGLGVMLWRPFVDMLGIWWFTRRRFPIVPGGESCAR
jgi:glycosyltransferase involved in cell wall biosynthesis